MSLSSDISECVFLTLKCCATRERSESETRDLHQQSYTLNDYGFYCKLLNYCLCVLLLVSRYWVRTSFAKQLIFTKFPTSTEVSFIVIQKKQQGREVLCFFHAVRWGAAFSPHLHILICLSGFQKIVGRIHRDLYKYCLPHDAPEHLIFLLKSVSVFMF